MECLDKNKDTLRQGFSFNIYFGIFIYFVNSCTADFSCFQVHNIADASMEKYLQSKFKIQFLKKFSLFFNNKFYIAVLYVPSNYISTSLSNISNINIVPYHLCSIENKQNFPIWLTTVVLSGVFNLIINNFNLNW